MNQMLMVLYNMQEMIMNIYLEVGDDMSLVVEIEFIFMDLLNEGMLLLNGVMFNFGDFFI